MTCGDSKTNQRMTNPFVGAASVGRNGYQPKRTKRNDGTHEFYHENSGFTVLICKWEYGSRKEAGVQFIFTTTAEGLLAAVHHDSMIIIRNHCKLQLERVLTPMSMHRFSLPSKGQNLRAHYQTTHNLRQTRLLGTLQEICSWWCRGGWLWWWYESAYQCKNKWHRMERRTRTKFHSCCTSLCTNAVKLCETSNGASYCAALHLLPMLHKENYWMWGWLEGIERGGKEAEQP